MIEQIGNACCGCTACASICPRQCIEMRKNEEGFLYPVVWQEACVHCGLCQKACPALHTEESGEDDLRETWGVITKDKDILLNSSSGGLFTALAEAVLAENGCVFGAAFSGDFQTVRHIMVEDSNGLVALRGSKYVQSEMGNCFAAVKEQVKAERKVLFTGTPCQVAGLKRFLGKESDAVLFVDVICHGTPSADLWQRYLNHIETQMGGKVKAVSFRHKENGWRTFGMNMPMNGDLRYYRTLQEDPFMQMFLKNYCLRESCYHCGVKEAGSCSDITIGDFWGVERAAPEFDNALGVSLALIHNEKGKRLFEQVKSGLDVKQVDYSAAIAGNSAYNDSVGRPAERDRFFADLRLKKWKRLERKYLQEKFRTKIKRKLSASVIGKLRRRILGITENSNGGGYKPSFQYGLIVVLEKTK